MGGELYWLCRTFGGGKEGNAEPVGSKNGILLRKLQQGVDESISMFGMHYSHVLWQHVSEGGVERAQKDLQEERGKEPVGSKKNFFAGKLQQRV
jgi:hypothetical protein